MYSIPNRDKNKLKQACSFAAPFFRSLKVSDLSIIPGTGSFTDQTVINNLV